MDARIRELKRSDLMDRHGTSDLLPSLAPDALMRLYGVSPLNANGSCILAAILSMAADHTKNRLKPGLHRQVVPPSGGNPSNLIRQLDGRKKRKMPKEKKF